MRKIRHIFFILICLCLLFTGTEDPVPKAYAASSMTVSDSCVEFIKTAEGFSPQPYYDYKQYTVGYGTKCPTEKYFDYRANGIPKSEAEALLQEVLAETADAINKKLIDKYQLTLTQNQFDALVSFSFNIGTGWMTYDSTLRNAILENAGDHEIVYAFGLYCTADGKYLPGLITRRLCEANIYLNGVYHQNISDAYGYVYYDANGGSLTYRVQGYVCDSNTAPIADAKRVDDEFLGWYTDVTGGSQVTSLDRSLRGKTLFAHWQSSENSASDHNSTIVRVTGDIVNIRSGPGTTYSIVRKVYTNEVLSISHITSLTDVRWGKMQDGWICMDYTNYGSEDNSTEHPEINQQNNPPAVPEQEKPQADPVLVSGIVKVNDALRIRTGPGTNYPVAGFLFNGKEVDILEKETSGAMVWGRIKKGWICMDYVETNDPYIENTPQTDSDYVPEGTPPAEEADKLDPGSNTGSVTAEGIVTADALRIRTAPGTGNPITGFYYQNEPVVIYERTLVDSVYWGRTNTGWVNMDYVSIHASEEDASHSVSIGSKTVIADCLRVRKGIGTHHRIAALLYFGDKVTVLETATVDGTVWGRVDKGWICMDYVN